MTARPLVLGFDTSAAHCAAALLSDGVIVASRRETMARGQAERLLPLCQEVLDDAGAHWGDLDALGVGVGPGNFTGIRIAVSAARGLALSLGVPAFGVTTFEALGEAVSRPCLAIVDLRGGRLAAQLFDPDPASPPEIFAPQAWPRHLRRAGLTCVGDRAGDLAEALGAAPGAPVHSLPQAIARIAARRLASGHDAARPAPYYLRPADAAPMREPVPGTIP